MADRKIAIAVEAVVSGAKAKLRSVANELRNMATQGGKSTKELAKDTRGLGDVFTFLEGAVKAAAVAIAVQLARTALSSIKSMAEMAAKVQATEEAFERLADRTGFVGKEIIDALKAASRGTVSEFDLMIEANKAMRLGVATSVDEFERLMKIAVVRAREFGLTTRQAWGYLVTAIGRASPMVADNIGILLDATATYDDYASSINKTANELSILEKKEALRNKILAEGLPDLETWNEVGEQAIDIFERQAVAAEELKIAIGDILLPTIVAAEERLTDLFEGVTVALEASKDPIKRQHEVLAALYEETGDWAEVQRIFTANLYHSAQGFKTQEQAADQAARAIKRYRLATDLDVFSLNKWARVQQAAAAAATESAFDHEALTDRIEEAAEAAAKAKDIWQDYLSRVAEENYRFAQRVEEAQFRAAQAAERAAFRLYEILRDAEQRRLDLLGDAERDRLRSLENFERERMFALRRYQDQIRYMTQDHLDRLADLEWEYQQERRDLLRDAPWWVRQALAAEFRERERIRRSGDEEALRKYDRYLLKRIRAVDPVYARELRDLLEQYRHRLKLEDREHTKELDRAQDAWELMRLRAQAAHEAQLRQLQENLDEQLRVLQRELNDQREAWEFSNRQRLENEVRALENLRETHTHALDRMLADTNEKLSKLPATYQHWGYESWTAWIQGLADAKRDTEGVIERLFTSFVRAATPPATLPGYQAGLPYVPTTMPVRVHPGEAILPASEAQRWREGGGVNITIENLHLGPGMSFMGARKLGEEFAEVLGHKIVERGT